MTFVRWEKARRWTIRMYGPFTENSAGRRYHSTVAIVASKPEDAMAFVSSKFPNHRMESCVDNGQIDFIVDTQGVE